MKQAQKICEKFNLGKLISITGAGGSRNLNFVLDTGGGRWFVRKRYREYCDRKRIQFDRRVAKFLLEHGIPVAFPRSTVSGLSWWRNGGAVWEVYPFVSGRHLADGSNPNAVTLAKVLAEFHEAGYRFRLRYDKLGARGETDPARLSDRIDLLLEETPELLTAVLPYREILSEASAKLSLSAYSSLPHTLVHGDIQPANILMNKNRVSAFVDFDWCAWRPRLYDICWSVLFCCASHDEPVRGDIYSLTQTPVFDSRVIEKFLCAYQSCTIPFTPAERKALWPQTVLTWCHARIDGAFKVPAKERFDFLMRGPRHLKRIIPVDLYENCGLSRKRRKCGRRLFRPVESGMGI